jgi:radical SAM superfamily enzyme YgiQ (UPF0313 family)
MRVALVFPPFYVASLYNLPPLGLINLATALNGSVHQAAIVDLVLAVRRRKPALNRCIYAACARMILDKSPDVIGFSAQCTTYPAVIRIAEKIKKIQPSVTIVVGGHNASYVDASTLRAFPWVDAIVRGEGEITLRELVDAYDAGKQLEDIDGLTFRRGRKVIRTRDREFIADLDELALPDYSLADPLEVYREACGLPRSIAIVEAGRGCPHRCIYCSESMLWRRRTRTFSVSRMIREMCTLRDRHGAECFLLAHDQFTANRAFVTDFCTRVIARDLHRLPWYCISRLDTVDDSLLRLMREAGCESMCYGIDSGSKKTLAFINKRIDQGMVYDRVRETTGQGMVPTLSFVIGFPQEQREDIDATLMLALATGIQGNINPLIQLPTVLPGTELFARYANRLTRSVDTYFSLGLEFAHGKRLRGDDRLIDRYPQIFSSFYNLACPGMALAELDTLARFFALMVNLFPKSFMLLCLALKWSPSTLFSEFCSSVMQRRGLSHPALTPADCYAFFADFALERFASAPFGTWRHAGDIVACETAAIEVARFAQMETAGTADLCRLQEERPVRRRNVLVKVFTYPLPEIIADMKAGKWSPSYAPQETVLVFRQEGSALEILTINAFGKEFLDLSDGSRCLPDIARQLYMCYGERKGIENFIEDCREAAVLLERLQLIDSIPETGSF